MTDFNDVARASAAKAARMQIQTWVNKAARPLGLAYVKTIEEGGNAIPDGLANIAVDEIDEIFDDLGVPVREQPLTSVKARSTTSSSSKKGKRPAKAA